MLADGLSEAFLLQSKPMLKCAVMLSTFAVQLLLERFRLLSVLV